MVSQRSTKAAGWDRALPLSSGDLVDRAYCYLEDLFVSSDARGSGAGRALIQAVYRAADAANADQVYWLTAQSNMTARKLMTAWGRQRRS